MIIFDEFIINIKLLYVAYFATVSKIAMVLIIHLHYPIIIDNSSVLFLPNNLENCIGMITNFRRFFHV